MTQGRQDSAEDITPTITHHGFATSPARLLGIGLIYGITHLAAEGDLLQQQPSGSPSLPVLPAERIPVVSSLPSPRGAISSHQQHLKQYPNQHLSQACLPIIPIRIKRSLNMFQEGLSSQGLQAQVWPQLLLWQLGGWGSGHTTVMKCLPRRRTTSPSPRSPTRSLWGSHGSSRRS